MEAARGFTVSAGALASGAGSDLNWEGPSAPQGVLHAAKTCQRGRHATHGGAGHDHPQPVRVAWLSRGHVVWSRVSVCAKATSALLCAVVCVCARQCANVCVQVHTCRCIRAGAYMHVCCCTSQPQRNAPQSCVLSMPTSPAPPCNRHRCVHIHKCLGKLSTVREQYATQRGLQLKADLDPPADFLGSYQTYIAQVCGALQR